jgi:hypothetical protein
MAKARTDWGRLGPVRRGCRFESDAGARWYTRAYVGGEDSIYVNTREHKILASRRYALAEAARRGRDNDTADL